MAGRPGLGRAARPGAAAAQRPRLPLARPARADGRPGRGPPHRPRHPGGQAPRLTATPRRTAMHPTPASRNRPPATTVAGLTAAALLSAVIPAAAGLAFLISLAARRPLVAMAAQRWPWLTSRPAAQLPHRALTGLTAAWGTGLLAALTIAWLHRTPAVR